VSDVPKAVSSDDVHSQIVDRYQRRSRTQARLLKEIWSLKLHGHEFDLEALAAQLIAPDLRISRAGNDYLLESSEFDALSGPEQVFERGPVEVDSVYRAAGQPAEHRLIWRRDSATVRVAAVLGVQVLLADRTTIVTAETPKDPLVQLR
jgi:hypothetical protein